MPQRSIAEIVARRNPITLTGNASVRKACHLMRQHKIGAIPVLDDEDRLIGIFTGRDVVGRVVADGLDPAATALRDVMTVQPDTLGPHHRAIDALRLMQDGAYRHVPIVEGRVLVGIISFADFSGLERARLDEESGFWEVL